MCGRFVSATPPDELARYFGADAAPEDEAVKVAVKAKVKELTAAFPIY